MPETEATDLRYNIEELIPAVTDMAEQYTRGESSSISYNTAEQLLEAIRYCIDEINESELPTYGKLDPTKACRIGQDIIKKKVSEAQKKYSCMIENFYAYGNRAYNDTVALGIPEFFRHYDARFCPQNHLLSLDYPVLLDLENFRGIDRISRYIDCICIEQEYLSLYSDEYITSMLRMWNRNYEDIFINVLSIVHRCTVGKLIAGKKADLNRYDADDIKRLSEKIQGFDDFELKTMINGVTDNMIRSSIGDRSDIIDYIRADTDDFSCELRNTSQHGSLGTILV